MRRAKPYSVDRSFFVYTICFVSRLNYARERYFIRRNHRLSSSAACCFCCPFGHRAYDGLLIVILGRNRKLLVKDGVYLLRRSSRHSGITLLLSMLAAASLIISTTIIFFSSSRKADAKDLSKSLSASRLRVADVSRVAYVPTYTSLNNPRPKW